MKVLNAVLGFTIVVFLGLTVFFWRESSNYKRQVLDSQKEVESLVSEKINDNDNENFDKYDDLEERFQKNVKVIKDMGQRAVESDNRIKQLEHERGLFKECYFFYKDYVNENSKATGSNGPNPVYNHYLIEKGYNLTPEDIEMLTKE